MACSGEKGQLGDDDDDDDSPAGLNIDADEQGEDEVMIDLAGDAASSQSQSRPSSLSSSEATGDMNGNAEPNAPCRPDSPTPQIQPRTNNR